MRYLLGLLDRYGYVIAATGAVGLGTQLVPMSAPATLLVHLAAIFISALHRGIPAGILGTLLASGGLIYQLGFVPDDSTIHSLSDLLPVMVVFTTVALAVSYLGWWYRQSIQVFAQLPDTIMHMADAVLLADDKGRITFLNEKALALTGWSDSKALRAPSEQVLPLVDEANRQLLPSPVNWLLRKEGKAVPVTVALLPSRDGSERLVEYWGEVIKNPDDAPAGVLLGFRDITERRRAEQVREHELAEAKEVEEMFRQRIAQLTEAEAKTKERLAALESEKSQFQEQLTKREADAKQNATKLQQELADLGKKHKEELDRLQAERKQTEAELRQVLQKRDAELSEAKSHGGTLDATQAKLREQLVEQQQVVENLRR